MEVYNIDEIEGRRIKVPGIQGSQRYLGDEVYATIAA